MAARNPAPTRCHDFAVVIPHLDYSDHLKACLLSILAQEGRFTAHIHIQDGGTGSAVSDLLRQSQGWVDSSRFLLTHTQEPDTGAAEAINRGFSRVRARMLTWLGADDMLMPGALESVGSLIDEYPEISWVTGLPHVISTSGIPAPHHGASGFHRFPTGYSREALKRGLHAGEINHGFIQQEGTFWSDELWKAAGGLDETLRLAFDFDLWCRLAEHTGLMEVVAPLGAFRKRPGQASEDRAGYLAEVDELREKYLRKFGRPSTGLEPTFVAFIEYDTYRWSIGRRSFLVVDRGLRFRVPSMAQDTFRFQVVANLRARADKSGLSRLALRVLRRLRKWRSV